MINFEKRILTNCLEKYNFNCLIKLFYINLSLLKSLYNKSLFFTFEFLRNIIKLIF